MSSCNRKVSLHQGRGCTVFEADLTGFFIFTTMVADANLQYCGLMLLLEKCVDPPAYSMRARTNNPKYCQTSIKKIYQKMPSILDFVEAEDYIK